MIIYCPSLAIVTTTIITAGCSSAETKLWSNSCSMQATWMVTGTSGHMHAGSMPLACQGKQMAVTGRVKGKGEWCRQIKWQAGSL